MNELQAAVEQLRRSLHAIEPHLTAPDVATSDLEEFKSTLDRARNRVQAILNAAQAKDVPEVIVKYRLRRTAHLCQGVVGGLSDWTISAKTPGFARLRAIVGETLERLDALRSPS